MDALINKNKVWFKTKAQARRAWMQRTGVQIFKQKAGRHAGQFFVGTYIDFINRY